MSDSKENKKKGFFSRLFGGSSSPEEPKKEEAKSGDIDDVAVGDGSEQVDPADLTNSMAAYTAAITKTKDIKLSN